MRRRLALLTLLLAGLLAGCSSPRRSPANQSPPPVWSELNAGMTRQEIIGRLGQPTGRSPAGEETWRRGNWELHVGYNERGQAITIVRQLLAR
jgi:outer membrane protein assembly factor BamE (lipoprotein component of BamABCDE complex)